MLMKIAIVLFVRKEMNSLFQLFQLLQLFKGKNSHKSVGKIDVVWNKCCILLFFTHFNEILRLQMNFCNFKSVSTILLNSINFLKEISTFYEFL